MATANKFNAFAEDVAHKLHALNADQMTFALTNTLPAAANSRLADLTEIDYTNLSARDITLTSSGQTGGVYQQVLEDLTLTSTGGPTGPFQYVVLYNSTAPGGPLIEWWDAGAATTLQDGESIDMRWTSGYSIQIQ